jgi:hypothetical protein
MSYSINISNETGALILDGDLGQMPLIASGSGTASPSGLGISTSNYIQINFSSVSMPLVFMRSQSTGTYFGIYQQQNNYFQYRATGAIDYKVFDASGGGIFPVPGTGAFGMLCYNSAGNIIYSSEVDAPFIREIQTAITTSDGFVDSPGANPYLLKTLTTSVTAYDNGLPYVSGAVLTLCGASSNGQFIAGQTIYANFSSATALNLYQAPLFASGSNPQGAVFSRTGMFPRLMFIIR